MKHNANGFLKALCLFVFTINRTYVRKDVSCAKLLENIIKNENKRRSKYWSSKYCLIFKMDVRSYC